MARVPRDGEDTRAGRPNLLEGQDLPPPPKQERSRRKREALLRSGLALFAERGYDATTVDNIAAQAGVAVGGFYQYFSSKQQLLLVLMDQVLQATAMLTFEAKSSEPDDIRKGVGFLVRQALHMDWEYAGAYRAWREAAVRDHQMQERYLQIQGWMVQQMTLLIQMLSFAPNARRDIDPPTLAWTLTLLLLRLGEVPLPYPDDVVETMTNLIYHAVFTDQPV
jgi:TetR/AcrR family transcriptional regulator, mexJK operon transcriptional repressor